MHKLTRKNFTLEDITFDGPSVLCKGHEVAARQCGEPAAPKPTPAPLPPGLHSFYDAAWYFTSDLQEVRRLKTLHTRSLISNPTAEEALSWEELEQLLQDEDWLGQVLVDRLVVGELHAAWSMEGDVTLRQMPARDWIGARISIRKNIAEIRSVVLRNVLVSQAQASASVGPEQTSKKKAAQSADKGSYIADARLLLASIQKSDDIYQSLSSKHRLDRAVARDWIAEAKRLEDQPTTRGRPRKIAQK